MDYCSGVLNALKAFSVLAETRNYSRAGHALNVTHAAVIQQVKALENHFGVALAMRAGRGVTFTQEGERLARELEAGFSYIHRGVNALSDARHQQPVQVTTSPVFAVKWLMPRIADFQTLHPDVTLLINPTGQTIELRPGGIDLAIRYGRYDRVTDVRDVLLQLDMVVVASPSCLGDEQVTTPADLFRFPWLQELGTTEATDWFGLHGVNLDQPLMITHMPGNLIIDAVKRGDGVTYTSRQWFMDEIESGELIEFFPEERAGFFALHTQPGEPRRATRLFLEWLQQQV